MAEPRHYGLDKKRPGTVVSAAETEHDASCIPCYKWTGGYNMGEGLGRATEFDQDRTITGVLGTLETLAQQADAGSGNTGCPRLKEQPEVP